MQKQELKALCEESSPLVNELIFVVDRAVKQAGREGGRYDTIIRHILKKHLLSEKIITQHVFPPIPDRRWDWCAYLDSYEPPDSDGVGGGPVGWGKTKDEAILDLKEQLDDC